MDRPSIFGSAVKATRRRVVEIQKAADAGDEIGDIGILEGVAERQHRHVVADLAEASAGAAPTRRDGLSSRTRSGNRASIASLRRRSAS